MGELASDIQAAIKAQQCKWFQEKIDSLRREDIMNEVGLQADTAAQLQKVPFGDNGVNTDGLRLLAQQPESIRKRSVTKFLDTWNPKVVRDPTGWLIGIIKN